MSNYHLQFSDVADRFVARAFDERVLVAFEIYNIIGCGTGARVTGNIPAFRSLNSPSVEHCVQSQDCIYIYVKNINNIDIPSVEIYIPTMVLINYIPSVGSVVVF